MGHWILIFQFLCLLNFVLRVESLTINDCKPKPGLKAKNCKNRIPACRQQFGIELKWYVFDPTRKTDRKLTKYKRTGKGCAKQGDAGCQCSGYCGYHCKGPCVRDSECKWVNKKCYNRETNQVGFPIPICPVTPTGSPTLQPSSAPTETLCSARDTSVDILWALDESTSVMKTPGLFGQMTQFVQDVLSVYAPVSGTPDLGSSRQAIVEFSGESYFLPGTFTNIGNTSTFSHPRATSPSDFLAYLPILSASGGHTRTQFVLEYAKQAFLEISPNARKVLVLVSDGLPTDEYGFPGSPGAVAATTTAAQELSDETSGSIVLIKASSDFPTGNLTNILAPYVSRLFDIQSTLSDRNMQRALFEYLFPCLDLEV